MLDYIKAYPGISVPRLSKTTGIPAKSIERHISVLIERNLIEHRGSKASRQEYFAKYKQRDEEARGKYRQIASKPLAESEIYVIDIIRNNWKNGQGI